MTAKKTNKVTRLSKRLIVERGMIYTGPDNVSKCIQYLDETLKTKIRGEVNFMNTKFFEPSAGNGSFYEQLKFYDIVAFDKYPNRQFAGCVEVDFLTIGRVYKNGKPYKIFIGFPPSRQHKEFVAHSMKLGADLIAYIMPSSAANIKSQAEYAERGYSVVFTGPLINNDYIMADNSPWDISDVFIIIAKDQLIRRKAIVKTTRTYKDLFEVHTINTGVLKVKETTYPLLFKRGGPIKNKVTGKPYEILKDENGHRYYLQNGINVHRIPECQLFLPLRVYPSKEEGMIFYETFYDKSFANIGFGLKLKKGFTLKKQRVKDKDVYYIYEEKFKGIHTIAAKLDGASVKKCYMRQRYNNGVFVSSKKLIEANKAGIK